MAVETAMRRRPLLPGGVDPLQLVPAREFDRLVLLLTHVQRGAWVFCLYNTAPVRDAVVEALQARLASLPLYEFTLSPQHPNPRDYLKQISASAADQRAVVVFYDAWRAFDHGFFGFLDLQRERFMRLPHVLIFWVREADRAAIARRSSNFFSRHAGVFDLQVALPDQAQAVRELWAATPISWDSVEERERQEGLYLGLLAEYEADAEPNQASIADLLGKLATVWYYTHNLDQAEAALKRRLGLVKALGDQAHEAESLFLLGLIASRRYEHVQALDLYAQALQLFRAVGDRLGEANTLKAIGDVQQFRKEVSAALDSYTQALTLFRAVGDRLGEANTLQAIGDVQQFQDQRDAALDSYTQALTLFRAVGARLGEANTLQAIGEFYLDTEEEKRGLELLAQALALYEGVKARAGQANTCWMIGTHLVRKGALTEGEPWLVRAVQLGDSFAPDHPFTLQMHRVLEEVRATLSGRPSPS